MDKIRVRHVLECLPWREVDPVLIALARLLCPGGTLTLKVANGEQIARAYVGGVLRHHEAQRLLYGNQAHPEDACHSLWSTEEVQRRLEMAGLIVEVVKHHGYFLIVRARRPE